MAEKKSKHNKKIKVPVKIVKNIETISVEIKKEMKLGLSKLFFKKIANLAFILFILLSQVIFLSAFEAHVINVTARICIPLETRTPGYWKTHPEVYEPYLPVSLGCETISTVPEADAVFWKCDAVDMKEKLRCHLLAMKFNIVHYGVGDHFAESCHYKGQDIPINQTINELVADAVALLCDSGATRAELEDIKNKLDCLNNLGEIRECATPSQLTNFFALPTVTIEESFSTSSATESQTEPEILLLLEQGTSATEETTTTEEIVTTTEEATTAEEATTTLETTTTEETTTTQETTTTTEETTITQEETTTTTEETTTTEQPPTEEPPAEEPSAEEPPVEEPPVEEPPVEEPPVEEPTTTETTETPPETPPET
ncbi:hypothetical protein AMJ49_00630 [Parcubacteria bacterium DG_74_2]|nr:MAG: hypothetical protein AMJ49_00630 [Parcubacteria bacterium DG_74_2]